MRREVKYAIEIHPGDRVLTRVAPGVEEYREVLDAEFYGHRRVMLTLAAPELPNGRISASKLMLDRLRVETNDKGRFDNRNLRDVLNARLTRKR